MKLKEPMAQEAYKIFSDSGEWIMGQMSAIFKTSNEVTITLYFCSNCIEVYLSRGNVLRGNSLYTTEYPIDYNNVMGEISTLAFERLI
jgi:hypothetical protein